MRHHPALGDCHFAPRDALKHRQALLEQLKAFHIHQIGARQPVLRDENGLLVPLDVREKFGRLAFEGRDEFGAHEWHYSGTFIMRQGNCEADPLSDPALESDHPAGLSELLKELRS